MGAAYRLNRVPLEDLFGDLDSGRLGLVENGAGEESESERDAPEQDRRDVVIAIPGHAPRVIPMTDPAHARDESEPPPAATMSTTIDVATPPAFEFLFDPPLGSKRYRVAYGGRGKGSSWNFARALLVLGRTRPLRILCAREYQSSIKDSVHKLLSDQIDALTLRTFYDVQAKTIIGRNGTEFIFKGLRKDIAQIKSTEGIDICWIEEAESVSDLSWQTLIPTVRKPGSEIWVSFNPALPTDATYQRFVEKPPPAARAVVRKVSYTDNPWLPKVLDEEQRALFIADPEAHAHVWGGEPWSRSDAQVLAGKWRVEDFTPQRHWAAPLFGADYGFAQDPTILVKLWLADSRLYLGYADGSPQMDLDDIEDAWKLVPGAKEHTIRADAARPEMTHELRLRKLNVVSAAKWEGSVKDGIAHLRTYAEIVIHPRCKRAIQEARLWRYKVDPRTQDILPDLQKGNDHTWDAVRYALAPLIRRRDISGRPKPSGGTVRSYRA